MEDRHRTILRDHRPNIVRDLEPNNILPDLRSVLTVKDEEEIKAQSTRQRRCEQLLEIIPRKGPNAFKVFVEALKEEAPHLASDLIDAAPLSDVPPPGQAVPTATSRPIGTAVSMVLQHRELIHVPLQPPCAPPVPVHGCGCGHGGRAQARGGGFETYCNFHFL
ncbi:PREDICTED: caspase-2-like [Acropora digitifera]|uniref:caspase-2-like n=1 Tax=Acropora digitifera TaxID=70779 RepID=UPI00077AEC53|nr:PREDICTED: caspase-2-like [Acropora digitifera]